MKNCIRNARAIKGLSQEDLANKVSVCKQTISTMETNKHIPSAILALKIAKVLNRSVESIFLLDEND